MVYNNAIPQSTDLISNSQAQVLENFAQINSQYGSSGDHVAFTAVSANGTHKQVTVSSKNTPGAQTDPASVIYTKNGTAASTIAQPYFVNQNATYPLIPVKAAGVITSSAPSFTQNFNVSTIVKNTTGTYTVTLAANAVSSAAFGVLLGGPLATNFTTGGIVGTSNYGFAATQGSFQINIRSLSAVGVGVDEFPVTFAVFQI